MTESKPLPEKMQDLLSRAVEKQVTEQRAVVDLLTDLRTQLTTVMQSVRDTASHASVDDLVADVRTSNTLLGERLDALAGRVDEVAAVPQLDELIRRPVVAPADMDAGFVAVEARLKELGELSDKIATLSSRVEDLQGLHVNLARVSEDVDAVRNDTTSTSIILGLAALREDVDQLADLAKGLPSEVTALVTALTAESEQRIKDHVDEAVFTLAEVLLRPRRLPDFDGVEQEWEEAAPAESPLAEPPASLPASEPAQELAVDGAQPPPAEPTLAPAASRAPDQGQSAAPETTHRGRWRR